MKKQQIWRVKEWATEIEAGKGYYIEEFQRDIWKPEPHWICQLDGKTRTELLKPSEVFTDIGSAEKALVLTAQKKVAYYEKAIKEYQGNLDEAKRDLATILGNQAKS